MIKSTEQNIENRVNKKELARKIRAHLETQSHIRATLTEVEEILNLVAVSVSSYLKEKKEIFWSGLGTFTLQKRKATRRINPRNGQEIKIPSKQVVKFKIFKKFAEQAMVSPKQSKSKSK